MPVIVEIAKERERQIGSEGYTLDHDDGHADSELLLAAICYAAPDQVYVKDDRANAVMFKDPWPWDLTYDKRRYDGNVVLPNYMLPLARRRGLLIKAAALIVAEIERLDRLPHAAAV